MIHQPPSKLTYILASLLILLTAPLADAGIVISAEQVQLIPDSAVRNYSMDVFIDLTDADDGGSIDIGNFQVRAELMGPNAGTDVMILSINDSTSIRHPQGRSLDGMNVIDGTTALGFTANFLAPFSLDDLDGLMTINYSVAANVTGDYTLSILTGDGNTLLTDPTDFTTLKAYTTQAGLISISAVPEPSSIGLLVAGLVSAFVVRRRRK